MVDPRFCILVYFQVGPELRSIYPYLILLSTIIWISVYYFTVRQFLGVGNSQLVPRRGRYIPLVKSFAEMGSLSIPIKRTDWNQMPLTYSRRVWPTNFPSILLLEAPFPKNFEHFTIQENFKHSDRDALWSLKADLQDPVSYLNSHAWTVVQNNSKDDLAFDPMGTCDFRPT